MSCKQLVNEDSNPVYCGNEVEIDVLMKFTIRIRVEDWQSIEDAISDCPTPSIKPSVLNNVMRCEYIDDSWSIEERRIDNRVIREQLEEYHYNSSLDQFVE